MSKPRVLFVAPTPPPCSGPEVMTRRLLDSKLSSSFDIVHYNISKGREVSVKGRFDFLNVFYGLTQPLKLLALLAFYRPKLLYTFLPQNNGGFLRYASFILASRIFSTPVVVRVTGSAFGEFYDSKGDVLRAFIRLVLGCIDAFIVRGDCLRAQFRGLVPEEKFRTIYIGLDPKEFLPGRVEKDGGGPLKVLFMGYLTKAKGAIDLLKAVPLVAREVPGVKFVFAGSHMGVERNIRHIDNPEDNRAQIERLYGREDTRDHVEFCGVVTGERKKEVFADADIFAFPSYSEAFPVVVLEAMFSATAVVSTRAGALPEVFTDGRELLFVREGSPEEIAEKIIYLARDLKRLAELENAARKAALEKFSMEVMAESNARVFNEVIGSRS